MAALTVAHNSLGATRSSARPVASGRRWDLGFVGIVLYLIVEYTRLPAMYPILQPLNLGKVATGMAALGWLFAPRSPGAKNTGSKAIDLAALVFLFGSSMSSILAPYSHVAWIGFVDTLLWLAVYFLVSRVVDNSWRLRIFIFLLLLLNLKLAQFSIREYHAARSFGYSEMEVIALGGAGGGSTGFFANAADFGVAMCVAWPLATVLLFARFAKYRSLSRLFLIICTTLFLIAALVCGSRGAVMGVVGVALVAWARSPKKAVGAFLMAVLLTAGILVVLPGASKQRIENAWQDYTQDQNAYSRVKLWKVGLKMFLDHPLFGVGPGNFARVRATQYADVENIGSAFVAHSIYVQTLAELGLVGAVPVFLLFFCILRLNSKTRKQLLAKHGKAAGQTFEYCLSQGLDLGLVGYLVTGTFVSVLYYPHLWILLGLTVGLNNACTRQEAGGAAIPVSAPRHKFALAVS